MKKTTLTKQWNNVRTWTFCLVSNGWVRKKEASGNPNPFTKQMSICVYIMFQLGKDALPWKDGIKSYVMTGLKIIVPANNKNICKRGVFFLNWKIFLSNRKRVCEAKYFHSQISWLCWTSGTATCGPRTRSTSHHKQYSKMEKILENVNGSLFFLIEK